MSEVEISPDLPQWMADHIRQYLETDGVEGHLWDSTPVGGPGPLPTLLLTTVGRRSGKPRIMPLIYGQQDDDYVIVASKGGAPRHPAWYLNLVARPEVQVQVADERFRASTSTISGEDREWLWDHMVALYPPYEDYQKKTDREIPIVLLKKLQG